MRTNRAVAAAVILLALLITPVALGGAAPTSAKKKSRAPKIVQSLMRDSDGNMYADSIVLVYNKKVRHKKDADGTFPFTVSDGYAITEVGKANGKRIVIQLQEKTLPDLPDSLAAPTVTYKRTTAKPVTSAKKFAKATKRCRNLKRNDPQKFRRKCRRHVQARGQEVRAQPFGGFILEVQRTGEGTVMSVPPGIDCGETCSAAFPANAPVLLETLLPGGALEPTWGGDCSGTTGPACQLTMDSNKSVTVDFGDGGGTGDFTLTVAVTGPGTVGSVPPGIQCAPTCEGAFPPSTPVVLTATPEGLALFDGWTDDCATFAIVPVCTVVMDSDKTVGASFSTLP